MKVYTLEHGGQLIQVGISVNALRDYYCTRPNTSPDTVTEHVNGGKPYYKAIVSSRTGNCWHLVSEGEIVDNWRIWEWEI